MKFEHLPRLTDIFRKDTDEVLAGGPSKLDTFNGQTVTIETKEKVIEKKHFFDPLTIQNAFSDLNSQSKDVEIVFEKNI